MSAAGNVHTSDLWGHQLKNRLMQGVISDLGIVNKCTPKSDRLLPYFSTRIEIAIKYLGCDPRVVKWVGITGHYTISAATEKFPSKVLVYL